MPTYNSYRRNFRRPQQAHIIFEKFFRRLQKIFTDFLEESVRLRQHGQHRSFTFDRSAPLYGIRVYGI
jgi:hypothetical protein